MMVGTKDRGANLRNASLRRFVNVCSAASMVAALVLVTGCPFIIRPPAPTCETNADCSGDTPVCNVETNTCVACTEDADCDDGNFCNGPETCSAANACVAGANPCAAGTTCDEATDVCRTVCTADTDCTSDGNDCTDEVCTDGACNSVNNTAACDDGDACTETDTCADGACAGTALDCDDSDACTTDSCADGVCSNTAVVCAEGETCNPDTGVCEAPTTCTTDEDCDDGLACNGAETCDTENADADDQGCVAGTDACASLDCGDTDPICTEADDGTASCECEDVPCFNFTLSSDNLTGTTGDDAFCAPLEFNAASGGQVATLQTGDRANGLGGTDTLSASFNTAGTVVPTSFQGIEDFFITNFATGTLVINAVNISGAESITSMSSVDDVTISGLQTIVGGGMTDIPDAAVDMTLTFAQAPITSGTTDVFNFGLSNVTGGTVTINTAAANGFETLTVNSTGAAANTLNRFAQGTGTSLATATFTGDQDANILRIPSSVLTIDGSAMSGNLFLGTGTEVGTYASFSADAGNTLVNVDLSDVTTGSGDDTLVFAATLDSNDAFETTEDVDCGAGTDIVQASFGASFGTALPFLNCEENRINATASGISLNYSGVTGLTALTIEEDGTSNTVTLLNVAGFPRLNFRGDNTTGNQTFDAVTYTASGAGGTADTLAIDLNNRGTALASGMSHTVGAITAAQIETVTLAVAGGNATFGGLTLSTLVSFTGSASGNLTLGTVTGAGSTVTTVNLANVVGNISATFDKIGDGASINLGIGNDTFNFAGSGGANATANAGAGNDTVAGTAQADNINGEAGNDVLSGGATGGGVDNINGGAGTDTLFGGALADFLTGGTDADTFVYDGNNAATADGDTISDFTVGSGGDIINVDLSATGGGIIANLVATNFTSGDGAAGITAADNTIIVLHTTGYASFAVAEAIVNGDNAATDDYILVFFNTATSRVEVHADADSSAAGANVLLATLNNLTTATSHSGLVAANFSSVP